MSIEAYEELTSRFELYSQIKEGFMKRTPRGREVTELAYKHLGRSLYSSQKTLFND